MPLPCAYMCMNVYAIDFLVKTPPKIATRGCGDPSPNGFGNACVVYHETRVLYTVKPPFAALFACSGHHITRRVDLPYQAFKKFGRCFGYACPFHILHGCKPISILHTHDSPLSTKRCFVEASVLFSVLPTHPRLSWGYPPVPTP